MAGYRLQLLLRRSLSPPHFRPRCLVGELEAKQTNIRTTEVENASWDDVMATLLSVRMFPPIDFEST